MRDKDQILLEQAYQKIYEQTGSDYVIDGKPVGAGGNFQILKTISSGSQGLDARGNLTDTGAMARHNFNQKVVENLPEPGIDPDTGESVSTVGDNGYEIRLKQGENVLRHLVLMPEQNIKVIAWNDQPSPKDWLATSRIEAKLVNATAGSDTKSAVATRYYSQQPGAFQKGMW